MRTSADPLVAMLDELVVFSDASARDRASRLLERFEAGQAAEDLRRRNKSGRRSEQQRLAAQRRAVAEIAESLRQHAHWPDGTVQPGAGERAPVAGVGTGQVEETSL